MPGTKVLKSEISILISISVDDELQMEMTPIGRDTPMVTKRVLATDIQQESLNDVINFCHCDCNCACRCHCHDDAMSKRLLRYSLAYLLVPVRC